MIMKAFCFIVLIVFTLQSGVTVGSDLPTEDGTERDVDNNDNSNDVVSVSKQENIPVLSDAVAILDDSDDGHDAHTEVEPLRATIGNIDGEMIEESHDADVHIVTNQPSEAEDDDGLIQINPEFVESSESDHKDDNHDEKSRTNASDDTKVKIDKALSRKAPHQKLLKFVKRHRLKITIALVVVAFRREIRNVIWDIISVPVHDPQTGKVVGRRVQPIRPTPILKILLFIHVMRQFQRNSDSSNASETNALTPAVLLLTGQLTSFAAWLMSDMLSPTNPAYIPPTQQHYTFERIDHRYTKDVQAYAKAVLDEKVSPMKIQQLISAHRHIPNITNKEKGHMMYEQLFQRGIHATRVFNAISSPPTSYNSTIVVMDWTDLDSGLSKLDTLRDEVSFLIHCHDNFANVDSLQSKTTFEVIVLLESPGGSASEYALAAQQILRLRQSGIRVAICVDKVAASGGYMIACTSTPGQLYAAPFAVLGSIGVIGQSVNIHKLLEGWGVTPLVFRGGKDKAPVGLIGEVTKAGMNKVQIMVDDTHRAFKRHVSECRPIIAHRIDEIATGDVWLGYDALGVGLIDRVVTSDEYIGERIRNGSRVLKLLKIMRGRSIFSNPQTELLSQWNAQGRLNNNRQTLDFLSAIRTFLDNAQTTLGTLLSDDVSAATRTPTLCRPQLASSS